MVGLAANIAAWIPIHRFPSAGSAERWAVFGRAFNAAGACRTSVTVVRILRTRFSQSCDRALWTICAGTVSHRPNRKRPTDDGPFSALRGCTGLGSTNSRSRKADRRRARRGCHTITNQSACGIVSASRQEKSIPLPIFSHRSFYGEPDRVSAVPPCKLLQPLQLHPTVWSDQFVRAPDPGDGATLTLRVLWPLVPAPPPWGSGPCRMPAH